MGRLLYCRYKLSFPLLNRAFLFHWPPSFSISRSTAAIGRTCHVQNDQKKTNAGFYAGFVNYSFAIAFRFKFENHSGDSLDLRYDAENFSLKDNRGRDTKCEFRSGNQDCLHYNNQAGHTPPVGGSGGASTPGPRERPPPAAGVFTTFRRPPAPLSAKRSEARSPAAGRAEPPTPLTFGRPTKVGRHP